MMLSQYFSGKVYFVAAKIQKFAVNIHFPACLDAKILDSKQLMDSLG